MELARDEVHCWCLRLDVSANTCAALSATLSDDEQARSDRLGSRKLQRRFIAAHGGLRALLGRYLGVNAGELRFEHNEFGKPGLCESFGRLKFNLSHSDDLALIGVAVDADLGVDLERLRDEPYFEEIARSFFGAAEANALNEIPREQRSKAFLRSWTRKEAYAKALGTGLEGTTQGAEPHDWSLYSLNPAPGYVGSLVVERNGWRVSQRAVSLDALAAPALSPPVLSCC